MKSHNQSVSVYFLLTVLAVACMSIAQAQDVQVNSANPSSAEQGTFDLDVEIAGKGFDNSAAVDFFVTGTTDTVGITVKKVKVRGPKKIIATINISDTAETTLDFDIAVRLSGGRGGKGTTLFSVKQKQVGPAQELPVTVTFTDDAGNNIRSDGGVTYNSGLADGGAIWRFILDLRDDTPDRELILDFSSCVSVNGCGNELPEPFFSSGFTIDALTFLDVADDSDFIDIPLNVTVDGVLQVNFNDSNGVAYGLKFDATSEPGTTDVQIKRTDDTAGNNTWEITADLTAVAILFKRGGKHGPKRRIDIGLYTMPTRFTLEES